MRILRSCYLQTLTLYIIQSGKISQILFQSLNSSLLFFVLFRFLLAFLFQTTDVSVSGFKLKKKTMNLQQLWVSEKTKHEHSILRLHEIYQSTLYSKDLLYIRSTLYNKDLPYLILTLTCFQNFVSRVLGLCNFCYIIIAFIRGQGCTYIIVISAVLHTYWNCSD